MATRIAAYYPAGLLAVEKRSGQEDARWDWRLGYIGKPGSLSVMESERKNPGRKFLCLICDSADTLKTDYGTITEDGSLLTITTENSRYTFWIGPKVKR